MLEMLFWMLGEHKRINGRFPHGRTGREVADPTASGVDPRAARADLTATVSIELTA
jgi:hypothetical protein